MNNGQASVNPIGGNSSYTFQWDLAAGNQTTQTAINLGAGVYLVTVSDANGCSKDTIFTIINSSLFVDAGLISTPFNPAYSYNWDEPANFNFSNLHNPTVSPQQSTLYTVSVIGPNSCTGIDSVRIRVIPKLTVVNTSANPICNGGNNGQISLSPQGGIAPYGYSWNTTPVQITNTATNLEAGNYSVRVTDTF